MTHEELIESLYDLKKGDEVEYFRGDLATKCMGIQPCEKAKELRLVTWNMYEEGKAVLYQKHHTEGDCSYFAKGV